MTTTDPSTEIVTGIRAYLREHFPDADFLEDMDARTQSLVLYTLGPDRYRLEITERFLDGAEGAPIHLRRIREWNLARELRRANGRLVKLATVGLTIE